MNKRELIDSVAEASGLSKTDAGTALDAVLDTIADALVSGDSVTLPGFGTFEVRSRAARSGRNPQTGETMQIAASNAPAFKAGAALKRSVNDGS
ncbi:MAG TPA: HU family DNA-binding protein [Nocardioides sp.]|nr:HU family DNA-binding protein [Nocardioides sp.]